MAKAAQHRLGGAILLRGEACERSPSERAALNRLPWPDPHDFDAAPFAARNERRLMKANRQRSLVVRLNQMHPR
jgi:hypothetical protein